MENFSKTNNIFRKYKNISVILTRLHIKCGLYLNLTILPILIQLMVKFGIFKLLCTWQPCLPLQFLLSYLCILSSPLSHMPRFSLLSTSSYVTLDISIALSSLSFFHPRPHFSLSHTLAHTHTHSHTQSLYLFYLIYPLFSLHAPYEVNIECVIDSDF